MQIAKGEDIDTRYGKDLTEIFRGFGEDRDQEATSVLTNALEHYPASVQRDQALKAIEEAQEKAKAICRGLRRIKRRLIAPF